MNIAMDIGNRNVCICYGKKGKLFFDSFQARFSTEMQQDYSNAEVVEIDEVKYCIEQGIYDFEFNKGEKHCEPLILCGIARTTTEKEVSLMIGCPAEHCLGLRQVLKDRLEGKTFNFKYNGEDRTVKIKRLGVIGEGLATYFAIDNTLKKSIKNLGILDIGGRTTNIISMINGKQHVVCSVNKGILDVKNIMLKKMKQKGKDYDLITIENLIDNRRLKIDDESKQWLINEILNQMKIYKIDVDLFDWFVTGGGSVDIGDEMLDKFFGDNCIIENPLYSNVNGYYNFMMAKWGNDE